MAELFYYAGSALGAALIAFGAVWYRQRSHLPSSLGLFKLLGLLVFVSGTCVVTFTLLLIATELAGFPNLASFQQPYLILSGIVAYLAGNNLINRMLCGFRRSRSTIPADAGPPFRCMPGRWE